MTIHFILVPLSGDRGSYDNNHPPDPTIRSHIYLFGVHVSTWFSLRPIYLIVTNL